MKVWIVDQNANLIYSGYSLCLGLAENGCQVTIITRSDYEWQGPPHDRIQVLELFSRWSMRLIKTSKFFEKNRLFRMLLKGIEYPLGYISFFRHYRREKPDVIHFQYANVPLVEWLVFTILNWCKTPFVFTVHNIIQPRQTALDKVLYRAVYRQIEHFVAHSQLNKNELHHIFEIDRAQIHVIPLGNYNVFIPDNLPDSMSARQNLNLPVDRRIVLFFGIIFKFKGLEYLIRSLSHIDPNERPLLVVAGKPVEGFADYDAEIEQYALQNDVDKRLGFIPNDELPLYFSAADVVALPYNRITQSGVILTAFSFGKPVVATRVGSFPETVLEGQNGYLVDPKDSYQLAEALRRILQDENKLAEMSRFTKIHADEKYDWNRIAAQTIRLYTQAIEAVRK